MHMGSCDLEATIVKGPTGQTVNQMAVINDIKLPKPLLEEMQRHAE